MFHVLDSSKSIYDEHLCVCVKSWFSSNRRVPSCISRLERVNVCMCSVHDKIPVFILDDLEEGSTCQQIIQMWNRLPAK